MRELRAASRLRVMPSKRLFSRACRAFLSPPIFTGPINRVAIPRFYFSPATPKRGSRAAEGGSQPGIKGFRGAVFRPYGTRRKGADLRPPTQGACGRLVSQRAYTRGSPEHPRWRERGPLLHLGRETSSRLPA